MRQIPVEQKKANASARERRWRLANHEKVRAYDRAKYLANPEKAKAYRKARYVAHPELARAADKARRTANPDKLRAQANARYAADREHRHLRAKAYRDANPERGRELARARYAANPIAQIASSAHRRALTRGVLATLTVPQWKAIVAAYKGRCAYCSIKSKKLTMDHVVPLFRQGTHTADNIVPACRPCNSRKRAGPPSVLPFLRLLL